MIVNWAERRRPRESSGVAYRIFVFPHSTEVYANGLKTLDWTASLDSRAKRKYDRWEGVHHDAL